MSASLPYVFPTEILNTTASLLQEGNKWATDDDTDWVEEEEEDEEAEEVLELLVLLLST